MLCCPMGPDASTGVPFSDAINTSLQGGERTASAVPILLGSSVQNPPADFEQRTAREVSLGLRAVTSLKGGVNLKRTIASSSLWAVRCHLPKGRC